MQRLTSMPRTISNTSHNRWVSRHFSYETVGVLNLSCAKPMPRASRTPSASAGGCPNSSMSFPRSSSSRGSSFRTWATGPEHAYRIYDLSEITVSYPILLP